MKKITASTVILLSGLFLAACGQSNTNSAGESNQNSETAESTESTESTETSENTDSQEMTEVAIGVNSEINLDIWEDVSSRLEEKENITLDVTLFGDYIQNDRALQEGELDANAYQYFPFMYNFNNENNANIVPVGYTFIAPMGIYGNDEVNSLEEIPEEATVAIPNDPVTAEHALSVLELVDLIEIDDSGSESATIDDISENPMNLEFLEVEASQLPRTLGDAEVAVMGSTHASDGGLSGDDALYLQTPEETPVEYFLTFAINEDDLGNETLQTVLNEYQTEETEEFAAEVSGGAYVPAWSEDDNVLEDYQTFVEGQESAE